MRTEIRELGGIITNILLSLLCLAQSSNPALDSMGANMARQNWERAMHWAPKAAEAEPSEKYWRYLNAAIFASRNYNADLAIRYATLVADSEIATTAGFGSSFEWLREDSRWIQLMKKVAQLKENERQKRIQESLPFREYQRKLLGQTENHPGSLTKISPVDELYKAMQTSSPIHSYSHSGPFSYYWLRLNSSNLGKADWPLRHQEGRAGQRKGRECNVSTANIFWGSFVSRI